MQLARVIPQAHDYQITCLAFNSVKGQLFSSGCENTIKVWSLRNGQHIATLDGHKGWVTCLVYARSVKLLISGSIDGSIVLWHDQGSLAVLQRLEIGQPVSALAWNNRLSVLAVGGNARLSVYGLNRLDVQKVVRVQRVGNHTSHNEADKFVPAARLLYPELTDKHCPSDIITQIIILDQGKLIAGGHNRALWIYDIDRPRESFVTIENAHQAAICCITYDVQLNWIISGSFDGSFKLWSVEGKCMDSITGLSDGQPLYVSHIALCQQYWANGRNGRVLVYDPKGSVEITKFVQETSNICDFNVTFMFAPNNTDYLFAATKQRQLVIWRNSFSQALRTFAGVHAQIEAMVVTQSDDLLNPDQIFVGLADGQVETWNLANACNVYVRNQTTQIHKEAIYAMIFSLELNCLITGSEDNTIHTHYIGAKAAVDGEEELPDDLYGHSGRVSGLLLLPNQILISISHDKSVRFWDLKTMQQVNCIDQAHDEPLQHMSVSLFHGELATCAMESVVKIWNIKDIYNVTQKLTLVGHKQEVTQVVWCSWEQGWITVADDDTIRLWSRDGEQLNKYNYYGGFTGHKDLVKSIGYIPDKGCYVTGGWDQTIRLWMNPSQCKEILQERKQMLTELYREEQGLGDKQFMSEYEQKNPLQPPPSMVRPSTLDTFIKRDKKKHNRRDARATEVADAGGLKKAHPLSRKLDSLDRQLLADIQQHQHGSKQNLHGSIAMAVKGRLK